MKTIRNLKRDDTYYLEIEILCRAAGFESVEDWIQQNNAEGWTVRRALDVLSAQNVPKFAGG